MDIALNSVKILDNRSIYHGKKINVHLKNGIIHNITNKKLNAKRAIDASNYCLSIGWFDVGAHFSDPGFEYKETLISGRNLAEKSGFTGVAVLPNTNPVIQTKNEVAYIIKNNESSITQLYPIAAITLNARGEELTEMIDLYHAGAVAFSDGLKPTWHTDILIKSLQYLQKFNGLLLNKPEDKMLTEYSSMHEGKSSTLLGLKGMPALSEELMIQRDLQLLEYAGGKLHFQNVSTGKSIALIKRAKKSGLQVSCDIAVHQIAFDDSYLMEYDTNYKVNPPLREEQDIKGILKGIKEGTIDLIVSGHLPQDEESKQLEFDLADFGIIGLQTFLPMINEYYKSFDFEEVLPLFTLNPRKILNLKIPSIDVGEKAELTLFDLNKEWEYNLGSNLSISKNSPLLNKKLKGKIMGIFNNNRYHLDDDV